MSDERHMKKIDMVTLDQADRNISTAKLRRTATVLVVLLLLAGGGYAAYRMISGEVIASRFTVNQMVCPACVITVQEVTGKIPGVVDAQVSLAAQDVVVRFRDKQTTPDQIKQAITHAGYPVQLDGLFKPAGSGINDVLVAEVYGRPLLGSDVKTPLDVASPKAQEPAADVAMFCAVGKQILLHAADSATVVVQPSEIEEEVKTIAEKKNTSPDDLVAQMSQRFGSKEKYLQTVAQWLGIRKLVSEQVLQNVQDPQERQRKTLEWAGKLFRDADVKIFDTEIWNKTKAASGQSDWKTLWPRMIAAETELKNLLIP
jgi:copper chaperone CopZ